METPTVQPPSQPKDFVLLFRPSISQALLTLGALALVLAVFRFQALTHFTTHFIGGAEGDGGLYLWLMQSNARELFSLPWFNTRAFYPYTQSLAWSDNFILPSLFAWPALAAGVPLIVAYNTVLLLAGLLNGYCTYRLAFGLTGKQYPSLISGSSFMVYAWFSANLGHPQLQFAFWIPLALLATFAYLNTQSARAAVSIGACVFLCFLCTVYYALFAAIAALGALFITFVLRPHYFTRPVLIKLATGGLLGVLPLILFLFPYLQVRETFGERGIYEAYYFSARAIAYLSAASQSLLYGPTSAWSHAEATLFPGFALFVLVANILPRLWNAKPLRQLAHVCALLFLLACFLTSAELLSPYYRLAAAFLLWGTILTFLLLSYRMGFLERKLGFQIMTNRGLTTIFVFLALLFFVLSLGPLGNPAKQQLALAPYRFFYELFPGFDSVRAIGRAGLLTVFSMCLIAAFSLAQLAERKRIAVPLLSMVLALVLLENYVPAYPLQPAKPSPAAIQYLSAEVADNEAAVIALPLVSELQLDGTVKSWSEFARLNTTYMNWLFPTKLSMVNGYSGQRTKLMKELPLQLMEFPDQRSVAALSSIAGLRYILYVPEFDPGFHRETFERRLASLPGNLKLILKDDQGNYLLELGGSSRLKTSSYLLAPSYPAGTLYIELMSSYEKDAAEVPVSVFATNHSDVAPIATARVKRNGEWERFMIELPKTDNRVRPNWLQFRVEADANVFIRETDYTAAH